MMKTIHNTKIIGIDHGYGNMKTANCCFPTGITAYDHEPLFTADMLVYGGRYYLIGEGHKEFAPDKIKDEDYYVLTLAAVAKELKAENLTEAHIVIAAGLPLTWTSGQKAAFRAYLMKNTEVDAEKLTVLQYALEQYTNWDDKDIPESVIEAFVVKIVASKDGFDWYLRFNGNPDDPLHCTVGGKRKSTATISVAGECSPAVHKGDTGCYQGTAPIRS